MFVQKLKTGLRWLGTFLLRIFLGIKVHLANLVSQTFQFVSYGLVSQTFQFVSCITNFPVCVLWAQTMKDT